MELTIREKCALIINSRHIREVEIRERERSLRVCWRNDPQVHLRTNAPSDEVFHIVLNDALKYIAYLDLNQASYPI